MNLYNEDDKRDGAPVIPSGASSFKKSSAFGKPMFSRAAGGIMERLKNLSRKDMAFVGIGLSVLVMAPVAEYMTSKPSTDNLLTPGFGSREGSSANGGVYEPGINALSQGSPDGSGEVITPLSSRDPSSLILGSQPAQAPVAPVMAPPPSSSFRDSMKDMGRNAFSEVAKSVGAPTPIPRMQSALRNFGSFFSGGEGTRTAGGLDGGKIIGNAKSASSKAAGHGMVGPVATAGYKGVASNSPHGSSGSAYDKLRSQADRAASNFTNGSAMNGLDRAAADSVNIGSGAGGLGAGGADSEKTGKPSNSTTKYEHSRSGESLEEMAAKQRMQKALDWEFFKKYEIPKQIINAIVGAVSTTIGKYIGDSLDGVLNPSSPPAKCWTTVADTPDWEGAKQACARSTDPKCKLKYVCTDNGGPTVITYSMGKEAAAVQAKKCICNEYSGGGAAPSAAPGATPAATSSQNPIAPGVTPAQMAANTAQNANVADYDTVLKDTVIPALKGYHDLAKKTVGGDGAVKAADPEKEKKVTDALKDAFSRLDVSAGKTFNNAIAPKNAAARTALNEYSGKVSTTAGIVAGSQAKKDITNINKLKAAAEADIAKNTCTVKLNNTANASGAVVAATVENCRAIVTTINESKSFTAATGNFEAATGAMDGQNNMSANFSEQIRVMDGDVKALQERHAVVPQKVNETLENTGMPMMEKIIAIADIDKAPADAPAAPAGQAPATKAVGETVPLRISAIEVRGITWPSLWTKEFKADDAGKAEQLAWNAFEKSAATKTPAKLDAPSNVEAAFQRPNEMLSAIAGASNGLASIESLVATAGNNSQACINNELKKLVDECYFGDSGCTKPAKPETGEGGNTGGNGTPPANNVPPVSSDGRPAATADNPHRFTPAEYQKVQEAQAATANSGTAVGGFELLKEGKCSVEDSGRTTGLGAAIPPETPAKEALRTYMHNAAVACDFVRKCAAKKGSQIEVPAECEGRTTRR